MEHYTRKYLCHIGMSNFKDILYLPFRTDKILFVFLLFLQYKNQINLSSQLHSGKINITCTSKQECV